MEIILDKRKMVGLVEQACEGHLCLPDFQRDFVWTREEVADLLRSILRGYFVGSLLLLHCDPNHPPFAPMFLRGTGRPRTSPRPDHLVLDGQQRLSSLIYALTAPDLSLKDSAQRRWFFVDLDLLVSKRDDDEIVFDKARRELGGLDLRPNQYEQRMLPCTALLSAQAFHEWLFGFEDWLRANEPILEDQYRSQWRVAWTNIATAFQTFEVPLVELPKVDDADPESIARVCAIFEMLNSTGEALSVYDLLTARLYRSGIRLHELWAEACVANARLRSWSRGRADEHKFGVLILRTLALLRGLDPKPRILIGLEPDNFATDWRRAAAAIERALELLGDVGPDGFGVFAEKWLPGFGLIPILAALRAKIEAAKLGQQQREELRRWYWCNVFMERYSSAVESKSRKDYLEMTRHWFEGGPEPEMFREAETRIGASGFRIRGSASYASAVYSGVFCLLARQHARDWCRGEDIRLQELQDHHVFPRAFLQRHGLSRQIEVNTIANRTLISNETNGRIKDKAPAEYLSDTEIFPKGPTPSLLDPHFLGEMTVSQLRRATEALTNAEVAELFSQFVQAREASIIAAIREACGVSALPDVLGAAVETDDIAADILVGVGSSVEEELQDLQLELV